MVRQPAVFLAHGSPLSALGGDEHAAALRAFGESVRGAKGIVIVSAHWQVSRPLRVTSWKNAPLIYDFGGFPEELYRIAYPAEGSPVLAARVMGILEAGGQAARPEPERGLDHGAWVPLRLAWPEPLMPVLQLSLPYATPQELFQIGAALRPLREDGLVVVASGGIVHNLRRVRLENKLAPLDDWAAEFDSWVAERVRDRRIDDLFAYRDTAPHARLSAPTTEHFDPLFVALGAALADEPLETIYQGFQYGNLSMRSFAFRG